MLYCWKQSVFAQCQFLLYRRHFFSPALYLDTLIFLILLKSSSAFFWTIYMCIRTKVSEGNLRLITYYPLHTDSQETANGRKNKSSVCVTWLLPWMTLVWVDSWHVNNLEIHSLWWTIYMQSSGCTRFFNNHEKFEICVERTQYHSTLVVYVPVHLSCSFRIYI